MQTLWDVTVTLGSWLSPDGDQSSLKLTFHLCFHGSESCNSPFYSQQQLNFYTLLGKTHTHTHIRGQQLELWRLLTLNELWTSVSSKSITTHFLP